jgi:hypothetical protein
MKQEVKKERDMERNKKTSELIKKGWRKRRKQGSLPQILRKGGPVAGGVYAISDTGGDNECLRALTVAECMKLLAAQPSRQVATAISVSCIMIRLLQL